MMTSDTRSLRAANDDSMMTSRSADASGRGGHARVRRLHTTRRSGRGGTPACVDCTHNTASTTTRFWVSSYDKFTMIILCRLVRSINNHVIVFSPFVNNNVHRSSSCVTLSAGCREGAAAFACARTRVRLLEQAVQRRPPAAARAAGRLALPARAQGVAGRDPGAVWPVHRALAQEPQARSSLLR